MLIVWGIVTLAYVVAAPWLAVRWLWRQPDETVADLLVATVAAWPHLSPEERAAIIRAAHGRDECSATQEWASQV
jgi:hypothetical protein